MKRPSRFVQSVIRSAQAHEGMSLPYQRHARGLAGLAARSAAPAPAPAVPAKTAPKAAAARRA